MSRKGGTSRRIQFNAQSNGDMNDNSVTTAQQPQQQATDTQPTPATYAYFWTLPFIETLRNWIALASIVLLFLDASVLVMWLFRLIPIVPPSFLYYGFVWYLLFIFTGFLTFFMAWSINKFMYKIVFVIVSVALVADIFLNAIIGYQIAQCLQGLADSMCSDLYLTQLVLLGLTIGIGFCLFALFGLFLVMVIRIAQLTSVDDDY